MNLGGRISHFPEERKALPIDKWIREIVNQGYSLELWALYPVSHLQ